MSQQSFAIASVSVAIICGTFFYPPPAQQAQRSEAAIAGPAVEPGAALRASTAAPKPARSHVPVVAMNTARQASADAPARALHACAFPVAGSTSGCAPMQKLAGQ